MEARRTAWLRLRRHERQLQVIDDAIHRGILREEGDDLHSAAALETDHRVNLIDFPYHGSASQS